MAIKGIVLSIPLGELDFLGLLGFNNVYVVNSAFQFPLGN